MKIRITLILALFFSISGCATTEVLVENNPYPSVIEWKNVNKSKLYDDLILAIHLQNEYQIVPMTTSKDSGLVLANKGDHNNLYYNVVKNTNGTYATAYAVRYTLKFLVKEEEGTSQILVNPSVKIFCRNYDSWTGNVWFTSCDYNIKEYYIPTLENGITARLNEDIGRLIDSMTLQEKSIIKRANYQITRI